MIRVILGVLITSLLYSCCSTHTEVDYSYADITIKRIDECGRTTFYYQNGPKIAEGSIWAEYSGINDGFSGYLKFYEDGKVEILSGDGYFQSEDVDTTKFQYKRIYAYTRDTLDSAMYEIQLFTRFEQEQNQQVRSAVTAVHKVDENEWW